MKMKTFCYLQKKHPYKKSMKETDCMKADKDILTKNLIVARTRKVDLGEILIHCLLQFPSSLSNSDDSLQDINKAALSHYLQAKFSDMKIKTPQNTTQILNGMAIIQQLAYHVRAMFSDLSIYIFRHIIKLASFYMSSRVDLVCDLYNPLSIKDSDGVQFLLATYCVLLMRIRKHLSN